MCNRLHRILLYFFIVSLPVQGIAAVARFECGLAHHSSTHSKKSHLKVLVGLTTVSDATVVVQHHTLERTPDASPPHGDCENTDRREPFRCGTCTTCSITAYAPPFVTSLTTAQEGADSVPELSFFSFTGHIPARIERPPRLA